MFIKALYVSDLHSYIDKTISQLEQIHTQVKNIQKSIEGIIALEDAFKGKTANSIRTFYQEVHMPFLLFLEGFIANYSDTLQEMKKSVRDMEPNKNGVIREDFLSQDVQRSFERMEQITMALTDEANAVLHSVKDIVNVPNIDDGEFLDKVQHAKKLNRQTIEKLQAFDRHNTAKLEPIHQDIRMMKNYISQIRELGNNGKIRIGSYQARQLDDQKFHKELVAGIENKAVRNAIGLEAVLGEAGKLLLSRYIRFAAIPIRYLQKHFGLKTMDYSYRAMHAAVAASGDRLTTGEFSTIEHQVISAVEVSDYKKVRQGTYYTLVDGRIVRKYQSESGSVEYELVDTIPENRWRPKKPEKNWLERSMDDAKEMGGKIAKEAFDFLIWDDAKTLMDPRASQQEKDIAAASLMPHGRVFKLFKAGGVIKFANKGKHTAKKVQGTGKLNKSLAKSYLRHIELKTGRKVHKGQTDLIKQALRNNKFEKLTPKQTAKHRSKFTSSLKDRLILEWEEKTNQKWPRYKEEVLDKNGEVIRSIGQPYDAHHIIENNFGGPHEWWNLHPAKYPDEHQAGIHGKGSPSGKLFPRR
ncbi:ribonuclease YxiD [Virgibacillus pantothenticus]|uniref:ribonuclease YeeF family protein n=1 Tax=Virgibacillus pantothenticus TaxID=1473 RepID=UPI001B2C86A4|nr:T7SS effector LXG polymorphic toxin [Virgibacillus pantothenticus]GIP61990.1 ribonuclease YxiD [Virgibacillus pantothenticus]